MLISKKIQWLCIINPYKQFCKTGGRSHNLHYAYNFKCTFSYFIFCLNMRTKTNKKILRKKSKLKMASFSNGRSNRISSHSKDVKSEKQQGTIADISITPTATSTSCPNHSNREGNKSKESIENEKKSDSKETSENLTPNEHRIVTVPTPLIQALVTNYGIFNSPHYNPLICRNPLYFQYYPQFQQNNNFNFQYYPQFQLSNNCNRNFMCRSDGTRTDSSNNTDAQRDRKLLWDWRSWQRTQYGKRFDKDPEKHCAYTFTIMSYNVLAQELLSNHQYLYKHHNPKALPWDQRWGNLLFEIKEHNADILCFQEVEASHVETYYSQLKALGYNGIYKARTGNSTVDGCAIYYKTSTLTLIDYTTVEYNQPNIFVLNRDNVAIIAKFAPNQNIENEFIVSTTHLLYNPRREDVRLAQTQVLLTEIDRLSYKRKSKSESYHIPIIITGDFNFMPNTPVYKLITKGVLKYENLSNKSLLSKNSNYTRENVTGKLFLPASLGITDECQHAELVHQRKKHKVVEELEYVYLHHSERSNNNDSKQFEGALFSSGVLSHHLAIKSAFEHSRGHDVEATTFQNKWITVDYIFYSGVKDVNGLIMEDKLNLLARYTIPTSEQLQGVRIPNMAVGSDHFSLIVKFKLNP